MSLCEYVWWRLTTWSGAPDGGGPTVPQTAGVAASLDPPWRRRSDVGRGHVNDDDENRPPTVAALAVVGCLAELVAVAAWLLWRLWR